MGLETETSRLGLEMRRVSRSKPSLETSSLYVRFLQAFVVRPKCLEAETTKTEKSRDRYGSDRNGSDRIGQTETAQTESVRPKRLRPNRPDRNGQTESATPKNPVPDNKGVLTTATQLWF